MYIIIYLQSASECVIGVVFTDWPLGIFYESLLGHLNCQKCPINLAVFVRFSVCSFIHLQRKILKIAHQFFLIFLHEVSHKVKRMV